MVTGNTASSSGGEDLPFQGVSLNWQDFMAAKYAEFLTQLVNQELVTVDEFHVHAWTLHWSPKFLMLLSQDQDSYEELYGKADVRDPNSIAGLVALGLWTLPDVHQYLMVEVVLACHNLERNLRERSEAGSLAKLEDDEEELGS